VALQPEQFDSKSTFMVMIVIYTFFKKRITKILFFLKVYALKKTLILPKSL